jgi:hypothetical protein
MEDEEEVVYPEYEDEAVRKSSFSKWPHTTDTHPHCTPTELAAAGFFHQHDNPTYSDACECFYCGVSLVNWATTDEPMYGLYTY